MAKRKPANEMDILLARSLFRADKWDPARDAAAPFEWESLRADYLDRSRRLLRTFEKDGLALTAAVPQPGSPSPSPAAAR